jgi:YidC/Oxa1 family membrane protein insertase
MERRVVWAILLMMVIAIAPALFTKKPPADAPDGGQPRPDSVAAAADADSLPAPRPAPVPAGTDSASEDTVQVSSPLYTYGVSTRGARLVTATLARYRTMAPGESGPAQLLLPGSSLLGLTLVSERDTVDLARWTFTPSARSATVREPTPLTFSGSDGTYAAELVYTFRPDEYRVDVTGRLRGIGPNGGLLLMGMGPGLAQTEADSAENTRELALVTRRGSTERTSFADLEPGRATTLSGPFDWAAIKSKYFVTAVLSFDSAGPGIGGVSATAPPDAGENPARADIRLSLPVSAAGTFSYSLYAGPMEYERLSRIGHDFDDVNPYGWPGFRTLVRFFAVPTRWLLVWMHESLGLAYGIVLVVFGILVRVILWPLNQKAMRASMQIPAAPAGDVQAVQGAQREPVRRLLAHAAADAGPLCALLRAAEQHRAPGHVVPVASGPLPARPAVHHPAGDGDLDVRAHQGGTAGDGAQSPDEDDALLHARGDDGAVRQLPVGTQPVLRRQQHRERPAAVAPRPGTHEAEPAGTTPGARARSPRRQAQEAGSLASAGGRLARCSPIRS